MHEPSQKGRINVQFGSTERRNVTLNEIGGKKDSLASDGSGFSFQTSFKEEKELITLKLAKSTSIYNFLWREDSKGSSL